MLKVIDSVLDAAKEQEKKDILESLKDIDSFLVAYRNEDGELVYHDYNITNEIILICCSIINAHYFKDMYEKEH